jgi:hypothetical protein
MKHKFSSIVFEYFEWVDVGSTSSDVLQDVMVPDNVQFNIEFQIIIFSWTSQI